MPIIQDRRTFLAGLTAAGAAGLIRHLDTGLGRAAAGDGDRALRGLVAPDCCIAPYIAEGLLRGEGFTDFRYVQRRQTSVDIRVDRAWRADFGLISRVDHIASIDAGVPIKVLCGVHVGCLELFANEGISSVMTLRARVSGLGRIGSDPHLFVSAMATYVGLDPVNDIKWVDPATSTRSSSSPRTRSMPFWASRQSSKSCGSVSSATRRQHRPSIAPGRSTSAACWPPARTM